MNSIYDFLENTYALPISGYQRNIEFISSTFFNFLYFEMCRKYKNINALNDKMFDLYEELCDALKFKIYS